MTRPPQRPYTNVHENDCPHGIPIPQRVSPALAEYRRKREQERAEQAAAHQRLRETIKRLS